MPLGSDEKRRTMGGAGEGTVVVWTMMVLKVLIVLAGGLGAFIASVFWLSVIISGIFHLYSKVSMKSRFTFMKVFPYAIYVSLFLATITVILFVVVKIWYQ